MNKTKIDWGIPNLLTWNPVVGCKHGCSYCYARRISDRFNMIPVWDEPQYFPERLKEPYSLKTPSRIFVGSMCDLFGEWVLSGVIEEILKVVDETPHTYMFLTKNPKRYAEFMPTKTTVMPKNVILGGTITKGDAIDSNIVSTIGAIGGFGYRTFLSIEPLLGDMGAINFSCIDQLIVGAMTGSGAIQPKQSWIESIEHENIYWKPSIRCLTAL